MKKQILITLLAVLIAFTTLAQDNGWASYDFTKHFTLKNGGGAKIFAQNKRLYIANFQVSQKILATGTQMGSDNFAKMSVSMSPMDLKAYQALVDKLYGQFVERLKSEGYEIVSDEEVANSEFAKEQHNGKTVFAMYVKEPVYDKDQFQNQFVYIWPSNKFIVINTKAVLGTWPTKFGKSINANVVSVNLMIDPVTFDGSKRSGYKKGAGIEATPMLLVNPLCSASNERGGFGVWGTPVGGGDQWVGPNGMKKTDGSTTVFGSVKGSYVLDVNQDAYLSMVETLASGLSNGFVTSIVKESK